MNTSDYYFCTSGQHRLPRPRPGLLIRFGVAPWPSGPATLNTKGGGRQGVRGHQLEARCEAPGAYAKTLTVPRRERVEEGAFDVLQEREESQGHSDFVGLGYAFWGQDGE